MTSIDDGTQTVDMDAQSNDWQDVVFHAKAMQQAIERYKSNCTPSQDINSTTSVTSQLSASGSAILTFVNTIADTVDPLIKSLNSGTPLDNISEIAQVLSLFQVFGLILVEFVAHWTLSLPPTQKLTTAQQAAMQTLKKSLSEADTSSTSDNDKKPSAPAAPAVVTLPPDMQAIKDAFDQMGGKTDPRMGLGKIPPQFLPKTNT